MRAIYKRELRGYFTSMMGYLPMAFLLLLNGIFFTAYNLQYGYADYYYALYSLNIVLLFICPLLTMRVFSEERKQRTEQLLLCSPVSLTDIVLGKYLAVLTVFAVPCAVFATCPLVLRIYGAPNVGRSYAMLLAFFLLGAACLAIGVYLSNLTENQIVAAVVSFAVLLLAYLMDSLKKLVESSTAAALLTFTLIAVLAGVVLYLMTKNYMLAAIVWLVLQGGLLIVYLVKADVLPGALQSVLGVFSLFAPFGDFFNGTFSVTGIVYYLSVIFLFLFLTVQGLDKRRYS